MPKHVDDYFRGMDVISVSREGGARPLLADQLLDRHKRGERTLADPLATEQEILGRNTWMIWCGGNEAFWDWLANNSHGFLDLLKVLDSRRRPTRWRDAGLVNEPGMRQASAPDEFGLWLDEPDDPAELEYRRTVVRSAFGSGGTGAADYYAQPAQRRDGTAIPPVEIYGLSSGIVGLRLFPNPKFSEARSRWKTDAFYTNPEFYNNPDLVRPFRVGMSCAFCHASAHPLNPPIDPANPRWENISGVIGSQYLRMRAVFGNLLKPDNFVYHILDSQLPGTIDTSLIASDNINNANTMNAIFGVPQRVVRSFANPREHLDKSAADLPSLWPEPAEAPDTYKQAISKLPVSNENPRYVPRILLDGADSIGAWGALARVYLNIGTYHQQWVRLHEPLVGFVSPQAGSEEDRERGRTQLPFTIKDCAGNSVYWQATQLRVGALRDYFLRATPSMPLLDARGGNPDAVRIDVTKLARGRRVFATNCIVCHSSIQPETDDFPAAEERDEYARNHHEIIAARRSRIAAWEESGEPWDHDPGQWLRDEGYRAWATSVVERADFWQQNFLSSDMRIPVNYVGTNSGRALATNGIEGHMWQDFSSESYRHLPSVGSISFFNPFTGKDELFEARHRVAQGVPPAGGGPGFYRPPPLISVWATAPLLHNNSLGHFNNDPSVEGRLAAFDDAIHKLLYPERRRANSDYATPEQLGEDHGLIWRTPCETYLQIRGRDVPLFLRRVPLPRQLLVWAEHLTGMGALRTAVPLSLLAGTVAILWFVRGRNRVARLGRAIAYALGLLGLAVGFLAYLDSGGFGDLRIGPIPAGTPVNLLANINPDAPPEQLKRAVGTVLDAVTEIQTRHLEGSAKDEVLRTKIAPALLAVSKCPDFVMDKGHYFSWFAEMSDEDKEALIELLKAF